MLPRLVIMLGVPDSLTCSSCGHHNCCGLDLEGRCCKCDPGAEMCAERSQTAGRFTHNGNSGFVSGSMSISMNGTDWSDLSSSFVHIGLTAEEVASRIGARVARELKGRA